MSHLFASIASTFADPASVLEDGLQLQLAQRSEADFCRLRDGQWRSCADGVYLRPLAAGGAMQVHFARPVAQREWSRLQAARSSLLQALECSADSAARAQLLSGLAELDAALAAWSGAAVSGGSSGATS